MNARFSTRFEVDSPCPAPLARDIAPESLRSEILSFLRRDVHLSNSYIRELVAQGVGRIPDYQHNWGESNAWQEACLLISEADWFKVYEVAELVFAELAYRHPGYEGLFEQALNDVLRLEGTGWRMESGQFISIGSEVEAHLYTESIDAASAGGFSVATAELQEAVRCISRRPEANLSGALNHAFNAVESVSRYISGEDKASLGEIIARHPELFPKPLDAAVEKLWGFVSTNARHGREDRCLNLQEVRLLVGIASSLVTYLASKLS